MTGNDLLINDSDLVTKRLDNIDSTKDIATLLLVGGPHITAGAALQPLKKALRPKAWVAV